MHKEDYQQLFRISLLGEANVGKSAIQTRYVDGYFGDKLPSAIGIEFKHKFIDIDPSMLSKDYQELFDDDKPIRCKLQVWDTAGQERFRCITQRYYKNAHAFTLVYDITDRASFSAIDGWLNEIRNHAPTAEVILLGNKWDLSQNREVEFLDGAKYAEEQGIPFMEISAKDDINVINAYEHLVIELLSKSFKTNPNQIQSIQLNANTPVIQEKQWGLSC